MHIAYHRRTVRQDIHRPFSGIALHVGVYRTALTVGKYAFIVIVGAVERFADLKGVGKAPHCHGNVRIGMERLLRRALLAAFAYGILASAGRNHYDKNYQCRKKSCIHLPDSLCLANEHSVNPFLNHFMKLVRTSGISASGQSGPEACIFFRSQAMFRPRVRIVCIPSPSCSTSSGARP